MALYHVASQILRVSIFFLTNPTNIVLPFLLMADILRSFLAVHLLHVSVQVSLRRKFILAFFALERSFFGLVRLLLLGLLGRFVGGGII